MLADQLFNTPMVSLAVSLAQANGTVPPPTVRMYEFRESLPQMSGDLGCGMHHAVEVRSSASVIAHRILNSISHRSLSSSVCARSGRPAARRSARPRKSCGAGRASLLMVQQVGLVSEVPYLSVLIVLRPFCPQVPNGFHGHRKRKPASGSSPLERREWSRTLLAESRWNGEHTGLPGSALAARWVSGHKRRHCSRTHYREPLKQTDRCTRFEC